MKNYPRYNIPTSPGMLFMLSCWLLFIQTGYTQTCTVTTTADSGTGSLRTALTCAKNNPGADTIISGTRPHMIQLSSGMYCAFNFGTNSDMSVMATSGGISGTFAACVPAQNANSCRYQDSLELVKLYNATGGPNWTNKWDLSRPMTTWYGIRLNAQGCVACIDMDGTLDCAWTGTFNGNNLNGTLPNLSLANLGVLVLPNNQLSGSIPSFAIPTLRQLFLAGNQFTGDIPNFNLPRLQLLQLGQNKLTGAVPNFNLPELTQLYLFDNALTGPLPNMRLPKLEVFQAHINRLTGPLPDFNFPVLYQLWLYGNQLTGEIPNFSRVSSLKELWLHNNFLTRMPVFDKTPLLESINFFNNRLVGNIPALNLPSLILLSLAHNELTGMQPGFNLPKLQIFHLNNNRFASLPNLSTLPIQPDQPNWDRGLRSFNNRLSFDDILPNIRVASHTYTPQDSIFRDTTITRTPGRNLTIDLGIDAGLTTNVYQWYKNGQLWTPPAGNQVNSNKLIFNALQIADTGEYWVHVTNPGAPLLTLKSYKIRINVSPDVNSCRYQDSLQLVVLYNATNGPGWTNKWDLSKPMTTWYGIRLNTQGCVQCIGMDGDNDPCNAEGGLPGNSLKGSIPPTIVNLKELEVLNLYKNELFGPLPSDIGRLSKLKILTLALNKLNGPIPDSIYDLLELTSLELGSNNFTGGVSPKIGRLINLDFLGMAGNSLTGELPSELGQLKKLKMMIFHYNQLSGAVPGSIAALPSLHTCFLHHNRFSSVPNFSNLPFIPDGAATFYYGFRIGYNRLTFKDVLPNILPLRQSVNNDEIRYAPQDSIFTATTYDRKAGESLTIDLGIDAGLTTNVYQWYKNGQLWIPPAGNQRNSNKLIFNSLQIADAGEYWVHVTNPGAPLLTLYGRSIRIQVTCSALNVTATPTVDLCGQSNGRIILTGPTGTATYRWSNGATTQNPANLGAGTYTVTVSVAGCNATATAIVTTTGAPVTTLTPVNARCGQANGSISGSSNGGNPPYNYRWSNGAVSQNLNNIGVGTYTITITDVAGCSATAAAVVSSGTTPTASLSSIPASACTRSDGSVSLQATGGALPYEYRWNNGATTPNLNSLGAGTYTLTLTDAAQCTATATAAVTAPQAPTVSLGPDINACTVVQRTLVAEVTNCPYCRYRWSPPGPTGPTLTLPAGNYNTTYQVTVTNSAECSASARVTVRIQGSNPRTVLATICPGEVYTVGPVRFDKAGNYQVRLFTAAGYDSVINLNLALRTPQSIRARSDTFFRIPEVDTLRCRVIRNDQLKGISAWSVEIVQRPTAGTADIDAQGNILYRAEGVGIGVDSLRYALCNDECLNICSEAMLYVFAQRPPTDPETVEQKMPNVFTPNGDGFNDTFDPLQWLGKQGNIVAPSQASLVIMNRHGDIIYRAKPYQPWAPLELPALTYYYLLTIDANPAIQLKGPISILRE